ncbi:MAG TPA: histidine--tRNA ligase [Methyloceanibacter sp.]|jgi:histidyl-tRNA synthetase|nr:histidine--tRNA ligase [Methyloceanibacter sp.]
MSKKTEPSSPEARLPKGLFDTSANELRATADLLATIRGLFERYGFEPLDTPAIEYTDALGKFLPDQDRPNEGVFSFKDDDEQWLSLRYDLTAPLARYVAENYQNLPKPFRRYQVGPVWRNEKPGPGRFRQFTQFDADTVGASSVAADAELCMLAADTLEALGVPRGQYVIKVNNRKVLDGVLESIDLGGDANFGKRLTALRAIDKLDRLGILGVAQLLGPGRKDESGDFTKGAGLSDDQISLLMSFLSGGAGLSISTKPQLDLPLKTSRATSHIRDDGRLMEERSNLERVAQLKQVLPDNRRFQEGLDELGQIADLCSAARYSMDQIAIDPSVVRGLEYYTGPVFEAELLAPIKDERGQPIRLGSVVSGGRYDGLVERFTGDKVPATGISIGVSRLLFGLQRLGKYQASATQGPVVVLVLDRDRIADYQNMAQQLRAAGIRAELYLGESGMKAQMKYADRRGSPCVVIQGGDEKAKGEVQIKNLLLGATLTSIEDREEYLKKQAEAQFAVKEAELVEAVRRVLNRHKS